MGCLKVTCETSYCSASHHLYVGVNCCETTWDTIKSSWYVSKMKIRDAKTNCALFIHSVNISTSHHFLLHMSALCCLCLWTTLSVHVTPLGVRLSLSTNIKKTCMTSLRQKPLPRTLRHFHIKACGWGEKNMGEPSGRQNEKIEEGRECHETAKHFSLLLCPLLPLLLCSVQIWPPQLQLSLFSLFCCFLSSSDEFYEQC